MCSRRCARGCTTPKSLRLRAPRGPLFFVGFAAFAAQSLHLGFEASPQSLVSDGKASLISGDGPGHVVELLKAIATSLMISPAVLSEVDRVSPFPLSLHGSIGRVKVSHSVSRAL